MVFLLNLDSDAIKDVEELIRLGVGDAGRLEHIKRTIQNGRQLYGSDASYLETLRKKHIGAHSVQDEKAGHGSVGPDGVEESNSSKTSTSGQRPSKTSGDAQNPTGQKNNEEVPNAGSHVPDNIRRENIVIINQPRQSSAAWYLLPIFLSIVGGVISYLCLRKQDPSRARKTLVLGSVLFAIPVMLLVGVSTHVVNDTTVSSPSLPPDQIRQRAIAVPYDALMNDSDLHAGEIIQYEGNIVQVASNFNSHVVRINVSDELFGQQVIWSNFDPQTNEDENWIEGLQGMQNPFGEDPNKVHIWGMFKGLREYEGIFGNKITVPEVDVYILERVG